VNVAHVPEPFVGLLRKRPGAAAAESTDSPPTTSSTMAGKCTGKQPARCAVRCVDAWYATHRIHQRQCIRGFLTWGHRAAAAGKVGERVRVAFAADRPGRRAASAVSRGVAAIWASMAPARRPTARFQDLGPDYHTSRIDTDRKTRQLVHQLQVLGHTVTLTPAA
jgi:hypothetical protein